MKIIIVGGGISGLSTYLFLKKYLPNPPPPYPPHEILIYESHKNNALSLDFDTSSPSAGDEIPSGPFIGGGLGVAPNGMRQLKSLSPEIRDDLWNHGYPTQRFQFNNAHNWVLGGFVCGDSERWGEKMLMAKRMDVWSCLRKRVEKESLVEGKAITGVKKRETEGKEKLVVTFRDGDETGEVEVDLVIGADGVRSAVREFVAPGVKAEYEGFVGVGGFMPSSFLKPLPENRIVRFPYSPVVMTFGAQGFFGYGPCAASSTSTSSNATSTLKDPDFHVSYGPDAMWWSTYHSPTVPTDYKDFSHFKLREELLERHKSWKDPVIKKAIAEASIDLFLPTFTTPKLHTWSRDAVVLVGDAAHALPPTSGQGVSQALEDAHAFSLLLAHYLQKAYAIPATTASGDDDNPGSTSIFKREADAITIAAHKYESLRKPRVEGILDQARRIQDSKRRKGFIEEWFGYFMLWLMRYLFRISWLDETFAYDIESKVQEVIRQEEDSSGKSPEAET